MGNYKKDRFKSFPLLSHLSKCSKNDHLFAIGETASTLFFSFLPLIILWFVGWLKDDEIGLWPSMMLNLRNGELIIYAVSLLAPVFFVVLKKRGEKETFPSNWTHLLFFVLALGAATVIFTLKRTSFKFNENSLSIAQNITFLGSLFLYYLVTVLNNSLTPNATAAMRNQEDEFLKAVKEHREDQ